MLLCQRTIALTSRWRAMSRQRTCKRPTSNVEFVGLNLCSPWLPITVGFFRFTPCAWNIDGDISKVMAGTVLGSAGE